MDVKRVEANEKCTSARHWTFIRVEYCKVEKWKKA